MTHCVPFDGVSNAEAMKDLKERTHSHSAQYMRARKKRILRPHNDALSIAALRVNNPDRLPLAFTAETQPKLQPALLSLSAIISQLFTCDECHRGAQNTEGLESHKQRRAVLANQKLSPAFAPLLPSFE